MDFKEQPRKGLYGFGIVFLILAAANLVSIIASFAGGQLKVENIVEQAQTTESLARTSIIIGICIAVVVILVLVYLGIMGIRAANGQSTGSSHIVIARICAVILSISFILVVISFFSAPKKDWVGLCTSAASVFFSIYYIRFAKIVRAENRGEQLNA